MCLVLACWLVVCAYCLLCAVVFGGFGFVFDIIITLVRFCLFVLVWFCVIVVYGVGCGLGVGFDDWFCYVWLLFDCLLLFRFDC